MRWLVPVLLGVGAPALALDIEVHDACDGLRWEAELVGQEWQVLDTVALPDGARVIVPGMPYTEDYRPERMNVEIGDDGRIARIWCG